MDCSLGWSGLVVLGLIVWVCVKYGREPFEIVMILVVAGIFLGALVQSGKWCGA